jgi:exonuclease SbcC
MRPIALHVEGFGIFRDAVAVDFDGVDYFALVGPTGAGKSTVIDAICFALYGSVPRYADERQVARVVSVGKLETKVSLTFAIGEQRYRATRVVRIRNGKASTPEAMLEQLDSSGAPRMLAGSARELKPAVERLLGLPFAHFTKCVVLPQGEFARFLHDDPAKRRDLLTRLLDLEIYDRIGQLARQRAAAARQAIEIHERQLAAYAGATAEARRAAEQRRVALLELHRAIDAAQPDDKDLVATIAAADTCARQASELAAELSTIAIPKAVGKLTDELDLAVTSQRTATEALTAAERALADLDARVEALPDRVELLRAHDAHAAVAETERALVAARTAEQHAVEDAKRADQVAQRADAHLAEAQSALDAARALHAAHALATHLVAGEPCPVCAQTVDRIPGRKRPAGLTKPERTLEEARRIVADARTTVEHATRKRTEAETIRQRLDEQLESARAQTASHPDPEAVRSAVAAIDDALAGHAAARTRERDARRAVADAAKTVAALEAKLAGTRAQLQERRDHFLQAGLAPPVPVDDLMASWLALTAWAGDERTRQERVVGAAANEVERARAARREILGQLSERARGLEVESRAKDLAALRDDVLEQGRDARNELHRIDEAMEQSRKLTEELGAAREEFDVADLLGTCLRSDRFEKWLLVEALETLVQAASANLHELSGGEYSLRSSDDGEFVVVDHRNADETRSVRTLSGGETFQASLALALALSDQLADLSAAGGVKLDAIILDEGFGTLDVDTLETVATTIESLGSSGRMVGVVTHVPALAERVPVRYRVARTDRGARVDREDA